MQPTYPTVPDALRILIADDDETLRASTAVLLEAAGFSVRQANDARAALALLAAESVSLVISDLNMPGNERLELVREIGIRYPGLPVVLLTGFPTTDSAIDSMNAGVAAYLRKPVRGVELLETVQRCIGLYEARRVVARNLEHLRKWTEDVAAVELQMQRAREGGQNALVSTYLDVSLRRLEAAVTDVREVTVALSRSPGGAAGMRVHELEQAMRDTIAVLERTKRDFKSKELWELRQRLTAVLGE